MPGRNTNPIPMQCVDATGRTVRLFNPAVRRGDEVVGEMGLDFKPGELRAILRRAGSRAASLRHVGSMVVVVGVMCAMLWGGGFALAACFASRVLVPVWAVPLIGVALATVPAMIVGLIGLGSFYVWGMVAFSGEPAPVVAAMLEAGQCPSCAYPFGAASGERVVCTECGAVWERRRTG